MWSRSTKQRRSAMRRRALVAIAPFRQADIGSVRLPPSPPGTLRFRWTETPPSGHYLNAPLVLLTPKETK